MDWLKNEEYKDLDKVNSDTKLAEDQKNIIKAIHQRNENKTVSGPSSKDFILLQKLYGD